MENQSEAMQEAKKEAAKQLVALVFMVIALLVMAAITDRDFLRTLRMRAAEVSRRLLTSASRLAGHTSMGIELKTGRQEYSLPYALSKMRDRAKKAYDKAKEH